MKTLKTADVYFQATLMIGTLASALVTTSATTLISGCFVILGWQILSIIIHLFVITENLLRKERHAYRIILLFLTGLGFISTLWYYGLVLYSALILFILPGLSLWHLSICSREVKAMTQKDLNPKNKSYETR